MNPSQKLTKKTVSQFFQSSVSIYLARLPSYMNFITPRIILMPFPTPEFRGQMSAYLNTHHNRKYMVWNLSEHSYEPEIFSAQVIDYIFIGYPNPPLEVLFALCNSIKAWLDTDIDNIAVIHCQATRCRSIMVLACFLAWNSSHFETCGAALDDLCKSLKLNKSELMFPSQFRYMGYIDRILNGERVRVI